VTKYLAYLGAKYLSYLFYLAFFKKLLGYKKWPIQYNQKFILYLIPYRVVQGPALDPVEAREVHLAMVDRGKRKKNVKGKEVKKGTKAIAAKTDLEERGSPSSATAASFLPPSSSSTGPQASPRPASAKTPEKKGEKFALFF
jgi:hypothetical protein